VAPGGDSTLVLGNSLRADAFDRDANVPGRNSAHVAAAAAQEALDAAADCRVAPGGQSTLKLGGAEHWAENSDGSSKAFAGGENDQNTVNICETTLKEPMKPFTLAPRQAPGGTSTVLLG
jgi:hypothetical protein